MTKEEAVKEIEKAFEPAFANYIITALTEGATVSDKEQEPCKDAVSVISVFEIMGNLLSIPYDFDRSITEKDISESMNKIRELPRVTPQETRKGHWIDIKNKNGTVIATRCSRCGNSPKHAIKSDFCPNCGADMRCNKGCDFCERTSECMPSGNGGQEDGKA